MKTIASLLVACAAALVLPALAQDPPERVGRLAFTQGEVAIYQDPDQGWEKAFINTPLTSENSLWTDPGAHAEMRVSGMALRLDQATQLDVAKLDQDELHAFVGQGSVAVRVRHFDKGQRLDFSTPHAAFRVHGPGRYRVDVDPERNETILTVFNGSASMRSAGGDVRIEGGSALRVHGAPAPSFARERARTTEFDRWTRARDERWIEGTSTRYVSTDMTGYEDLDTYGDWRQDPEYGSVWYPRSVAADWAPYRQGHWSWVRPWGWTWVGEEPWGYAPYHYGRWVHTGNRWGWYPGPRTVRPVWAPALVGWVGGGNFSVGFSTGRAPAVGWYPLAPWERYEPWYRANTAYANRVNVIVRDATPQHWRGRDREEWRYANRDRGATVVRRDQFVDRRQVRQDAVAVTPEVIRQAQVAPAASVLPGPEQFRRAARAAPSMPSGAPQQAQPQAAPQVATESGFRRPGERGAPNTRPNFERRQSVPAPVAATPATPASPTAKPPQQGAGNPFGRPDMSGQDQRQAQERAAREQQQAQERAAREQQQAQQRAARDQQQAQERAAREQQQRQPAQQAPGNPFGRADAGAQDQARQAQERAAREQQQAQERAAREQQAAQRQQQQQQQQQQQAQERAAREQQQAQERAAREQQQRQPAAQQAPGNPFGRADAGAQQAQERAAKEQQAAQRQQQQAQERASREAQRTKEKDKDKDKEKEEDNSGKGKKDKN